MRVWAEIRGDIGWYRVGGIISGDYQYATCREDIRYLLERLGYANLQLEEIVYNEIVNPLAEIVNPIIPTVFSLRRGQVVVAALYRLMYDNLHAPTQSTKVYETHNWMVEGF